MARHRLTAPRARLRATLVATGTALIGLALGGGVAKAHLLAPRASHVTLVAHSQVVFTDEEDPVTIELTGNTTGAQFVVTSLPDDGDLYQGSNTSGTETTSV